MLTGNEGAAAILDAISTTNTTVQASTNNPPAQTILSTETTGLDPVPVANVATLEMVQPPKMLILAGLAGLAYLLYNYKK